MKAKIAIGLIYTTLIVTFSEAQEVLQYTASPEGNGWLMLPKNSTNEYHKKFLDNTKIIPTTIVHIDNKLNNKTLEPVGNYRIEKFKMREDRKYMSEIYLNKILPKETFYLGR